MKTRRKVRDHKAPSMGKSVRAMAKQGRAGDTEVAHLTPGEVVVPKRVWQADPGLRQQAASAMAQAGLDPAQYVVGHPNNSRNPSTGAREFADLVYQNGTYTWVNGTPGQAPQPEPTNDPQPNAMSAAPPQDNRNWGSTANQDVNRQLAQQTGFSGDFGGGAFNQYMATASDAQRQEAERILRESGQANRIVDWGAGAPQDDGSANNYGSPMASGDQSWGTNPDNYQVNQQLAQQTGYTGNFGGGAFNDWVNTQPYATQQQAANILAQNNQPERIGNWGGNGFLNESPYINGTVPVGYVAPPAPPESGPTQSLGQGFNTFDFGTGQDQIKNFQSYFNQYGQVPVASGFTPENNQSFGIYDPRADFGGAWDPTYTMLANLTPEQWTGLSTAFGLDPNGRDTWLALENYLGQRTIDYGGPVYANGSYQGLANPQGREVLSPLERGYVTLGSGPNTVNVSLDDLISGKYNANAVDLALSAGYDPNGMEGTMNTLDASRQIMSGLPQLRTTPWNSAEFNTIRKPLEQAVPGFNAQVANRIGRQISQGRSIPSGNTIGPTDLGQVLSGVSTTPITTTGGGTPTGTPNAISAGTTNAASGQSILDGGGYVNNSPGYDRGWQAQGFYQTKDGVYQTMDGVLVIPQGNGLFLDTMYGFLRNAQGIIVNPDGSPVITQYNAQNNPGGSSSPWKVFGSSGAMGMMGQYAGVDLGSLNDGNNTPIVGNYGGGTPTQIQQTFQGQDIVRDIRGDPWAQSVYNRATGSTGGPAGAAGGYVQGVSTNPVNTGTNTNTGTNGTTTTGTGLTPGTTNPYSLPINFFFGMPTSGTGTDTGTTQQQSTVDPLSWLSLLNLGYGSSTYGYPTYQSADPGESGINYVQPNSQTVEFRSPFTY